MIRSEGGSPSIVDGEVRVEDVPKSKQVRLSEHRDSAREANTKGCRPIVKLSCNFGMRVQDLSNLGKK